MLIFFFEMKRTKKVQIVVYCIFISALHTNSEKVSGFYSSDTMNRNARDTSNTIILVIFDFQNFFGLKFIQRYPTFIG